MGREVKRAISEQREINCMIPPVRDRRGRLRWTLPELTPEQNLRLGVRNIQHLFLRSFPEFDLLFPRDKQDSVNSEKSEEAKAFILDRISSPSRFIRHIGGAPLGRRQAPYFDGSYKTVLRKTFAAWGINIAEVGLINERYVWRREGDSMEQDEQLGIANVQRLLLGKIPEIKDDLTEDEGRLVVSPSRREEIKGIVLEMCGTSRRFNSLIGTMPVSRESAPYFHGSYVEAIAKSLKAWGIELKLKDYNFQKDFWKGKTEEQCIELMQKIWLEEVPGFDSLFPRSDGRVDASQSTQAKGFILGKITSKGEFATIFSKGPLERDKVSYFEGSIIKAVVKTFEPWGLDFKLKDFVHLSEFWDGKTKTQVLEAIGAIFIEEHPEFRTRFLSKDGFVKDSVKQRDVRLYFLEKMESELFNYLTNRVKRYDPSFKGSIPEVRKQVLATFGINLKDRDIKEYFETRDKSKQKGWVSCSRLAYQFKMAQPTIRKIAEECKVGHPEWIRRGTSKKGVHESYAPELAQMISERIKERAAPEGWFPNFTLAKRVGRAFKTIKEAAEEYRKEHPEWFREFASIRGRQTEHFSPFLVDILLKKFPPKRQAPEGWMNIYSLSRETGVDRKVLIGAIEKLITNNPDWCKVYNSKGGRQFEYYDPKLIEQVKKELLKQQTGPESWLTKHALIGHIEDVLGRTVTYVKIRAISETYRKDYPEWFKEFRMADRMRTVEHFSPELAKVIIEKIDKEETPPDGWLTNSGLAKKLGRSFKTVKLRAEVYREKHPEWFREYARRGLRYENYSPDLISMIEQDMGEENSAYTKISPQEANDDLDSLFEEVDK